ncbi:MAG TPA: hypothetical protein VJL88_03740 [Nitrospira sp.]|nr:hypothetical protein [Nitrospira sp.]
MHHIIDFGTGVIFSGLVLSACWGWLWLVIGTIGFTRGVCHLRVLVNSLVVGVTPILLAWGLWWMRGKDFSPNAWVVAGLLVMPLMVIGLGLRKASDGRRAGLHMAEGIRHLKDELLGVHHDCGACGHDHGADAAGGQT